MIKIETSRQRLILTGSLILCLGLILFIAKLYLGNSISTQSIYPEVTDLAVKLAPSDPQTHYASAVLSEDSFLQEKLEKSLAEYEQATALSPSDYRLWFALGRARSRYGDLAGAEAALRKALELAPAYAQIRWALGNVLIRKGETEQGFAEIRKAAESNETYLDSIVIMAWEVVGGDIDRIKNFFGNSPRINAKLAPFLARQKEFDEAIEVWNTLPAADMKTVYKADGESIFNQLIAEKRYRDALRMQTQLATFESPVIAPGEIFNGDFEEDINLINPGIFEWRIGEGIQPQIGFDNTQISSGQRSLVMLFNSTDGRDFRALTQTIAVEPDKNYRFSVFYRTNLKTKATFFWEIVAASGGEALASTEKLAATSEWTEITAAFTAPPGAQAVTIRLAQEKCPGQVCPISGRVWFDNLTLESNTK